ERVREEGLVEVRVGKLLVQREQVVQECRPAPPVAKNKEGRADTRCLDLVAERLQLLAQEQRVESAAGRQKRGLGPVGPVDGKPVLAEDCTPVAKRDAAEAGKKRLPEPDAGRLQE